MRHGRGRSGPGRERPAAGVERPQEDRRPARMPARRRRQRHRAQVHGVNLELPARRAAAQDFDLGGGFHYSGSYPMVFQHSGARPRAASGGAEPREQRGERQPARAAGGQPTPGMVMPTGWIVVGHTPHGRRTPHTRRASAAALRPSAASTARDEGDLGSCHSYRYDS